MVNNILRVIDTFKFLTRNPKPLGALRANRDKNGMKTKRPQIIQTQVGCFANDHVAEVIHSGSRQYLAELVTQAVFHALLGWVNTVFSQSTGFYVTVKQHNMNPIFGQLAGSKQTCRASAYHCDIILCAIEGIQSFLHKHLLSIKSSPALSGSA